MEDIDHDIEAIYLANVFFLSAEKTTISSRAKT